MTEEVKQLAADLDRKSTAYILRVRVAPQNTERALSISRILPLHARRRRHLVKLVSKFLSSVMSEKATIRDTQNWEVLRQYDTKRPFLKDAKPPDTPKELDKWTEDQ